MTIPRLIGQACDSHTPLADRKMLARVHIVPRPFKISQSRDGRLPTTRIAVYNKRQKNTAWSRTFGRHKGQLDASPPD